MTRSVQRLRGVCAHVCSNAAMARFVDPTLADIHAEYRAAQCGSSASKRLWIVSISGLAIARVLVAAIIWDTARSLRFWPRGDRIMLRRVAAVSVLSAIVGTILLELQWLLAPPIQPQSSVLTLMILLVPAMVPLSAPAGLTVGLLWAVRERPLPRRVVTASLTAALLSAAIVLVDLSWVAPNANQAYRQALAGRAVSRGENELTLSELRKLRDDNRVGAERSTDDMRRLDYAYHARWAMSAASLVLPVVALAVLARWNVRRRTAGLIAFLTCGTYFLLLISAQNIGSAGLVSPAAAAWLPNAIGGALMIGFVATKRANRSD